MLTTVGERHRSLVGCPICGIWRRFARIRSPSPTTHSTMQLFAMLVGLFAVRLAGLSTCTRHASRARLVTLACSASRAAAHPFVLTSFSCCAQLRLQRPGVGRRAISGALVRGEHVLQRTRDWHPGAARQRAPEVEGPGREEGTGQEGGGEEGPGQEGRARQEELLRQVGGCLSCNSQV